MNPLSIGALVFALGALVFFWTRKTSMTMALVVANFGVFVLTLVSSRDHLTISGSPLLGDLAFRSAYLVDGEWARMYTVVTAAFLHADIPHVLGNMIILLLAGLPFEERIGRGRFLIVYGFGAITAVLLHVLWQGGVVGEVSLNVPVVGASGAVFGVLGGFAATYPRDEIPMFLIVIILPRVPVFIAAIVLSFVEVLTLLTGAFGGVAHAAHIGGAVGGAISAPLLKPRREPRPDGQRDGLSLDYDKLRSLATDDRARSLVDRVRENSDTHELQRAWLDRLFVLLRCRECGHGFAEVKPGILECDQGHREAYVHAE